MSYVFDVTERSEKGVLSYVAVRRDNQDEVALNQGGGDHTKDFGNLVGQYPEIEAYMKAEGVPIRTSPLEPLGEALRSGTDDRVIGWRYPKIDPVLYVFDAGRTVLRVTMWQSH